MKKRWMIGGLECLLPPNADKESTVSQCTGIGVMGGAASAVWFLIRYGEARSNLYTYSSSLQRRVLTGEKIEPFSHFAGCAGWLMAFFLFMLLVWMGMLYASFSQGSRSLYLMRRLPEGRKPLLDYVLRAPARYFVYGAMLCAALLGVYYIIWRFITPESCLRFS